MPCEARPLAQLFLNFQLDQLVEEKVLPLPPNIVVVTWKRIVLVLVKMFLKIFENHVKMRILKINASSLL